MMVVKNDCFSKRSFYKTRPLLTIVNDDPLLTIVNNNPSLTIVNIIVNKIFFKQSYKKSSQIVLKKLLFSKSLNRF